MANSYVNDFNTTVRTYYDDLKKYKPISRAKEKELIILAKDGDIDAQNEILTANLRFVFDTAKRYKGNGVPISELISEGNMGLIKAINKFDPEKNVKFISYAVWWVRNSMQEFIKKRQAIIRIEKDEDSLNSTVIENGLADDEDERLTVKDIMFSNAGEKERDENSKTNKAIVEKILSQLSDRERYIIEEYYGIGNKKEKNLEEIGSELGITKERVRQIKSDSLKKLRSEILMIEGADFMFN